MTNLSKVDFLKMTAGAEVRRNLALLAREEYLLTSQPRTVQLWKEGRYHQKRSMVRKRSAAVAAAELLPADASDGVAQRTVVTVSPAVVTRAQSDPQSPH